MQKKWSLLLSILFAHSAWASDIIGNGGDVVNCSTSVEMLDLYEGRTLRGLNFDQSLLGVDEASTVQNILNRLETIDPMRATLYRNWANSFMSEARLVPNADLTDIPDSQHLAVPSGCKIEQVVIQKEPEFTEDPRFIISEKLWNQMDTTSRASLILHELVYREALSLNHENSIASRYLNSLITSVRFASLSKIDYFSALEKAKFFMLIPLVNVQWNGKKVYLETKGDYFYSCSNVGLNNLYFTFPKNGYGEYLRDEIEKLKPGIVNLYSDWMPGRQYLDIEVANKGHNFILLRYDANGYGEFKNKFYYNPTNTMHLCVER